MTATRAPVTGRRPGVAGRRAGYVITIVLDTVLLWATPRLLDWGWPPFLTPAFEALVPLLLLSLAVGICVHLCLLAEDGVRARALGDLLTTGFALAVAVRFWTVFPFSFVGMARDWSWLLRAGLVVGIAGSTIALLVHVSRLVRGEDRS